MQSKRQSMGGGGAGGSTQEATRAAFLRSSTLLLNALAPACVSDPTARVWLANTALDMNCGPFVTLIMTCFMLLGACGGNLRYAYYCPGATLLKAALPYLSIRFCALSGDGNTRASQMVPLSKALAQRGLPHWCTPWMAAK